MRCPLPDPLRGRRTARPRTPNTGLGVPRAAGLEVAAEPLELVGDLVQPDLQIHPLLGAEVVRARAVSRAIPPNRSRNASSRSAPDGEPRGHVVAAEALQQVAAGEQGRMQIEARDAPARALADVAVEGDQEGGPAVSLDHARGDDADHAGMPALAREHEAGIALQVGGLLDLLQRLVEHALVERLPLDVEPLEPLRQRGGLRRVVAEQEPEPVGGVADPSRRVEPGPEDEAEMAGADLLAGEAARPRPARGRPASGCRDRSLSPCLTRIRFSPRSGTTSATVASATRSSRW